MGLPTRKKEAERKFANSLRRHVTFEPEVKTDYTKLLRARHARRQMSAYGIFWACFAGMLVLAAGAIVAGVV